MRGIGGVRRVCTGTMKKAVLMLVFWASTAATVQALITGSAHDFSGRGWGSNEICVFCHTTHNAKGTVPGSPLWNHEVSTATYTLYSSPTLQQTPQQPRGPSKLCLSCHDGTVAIDSFGNRSGTHFITDSANLTTNLSDDHPISIYWNHQTMWNHDTMTGDAPPCSNCHTFGNPLQYNLPFFNRYMECATCHEPHNKYPANSRMLRRELAGSAICLHCHGR